MLRTCVPGVVLTGGTLASGLCVCAVGSSTAGAALWGVVLVGTVWGVEHGVEARCWVLREQPVTVGRSAGSDQSFIGPPVRALVGGGSGLGPPVS